jgi:hypothetical protein
MTLVIEMSPAVRAGASKLFERTATVNGISRMASGHTPAVAAGKAVRAAIEIIEGSHTEAPPAPAAPPPAQQAAPVVTPPAPATPAAPAVQRDANGYRVDPKDGKTCLVGKRVRCTGGYTANREGLVMGLGDKLAYVLVRWDGDPSDTAEKPMFLRVIE